MKITVKFVAVVILVSVSFSVFAFENEPDGFRGIKWGTKISEIGGMTPSSPAQDLENIYTRANEEMVLGSSKLDFVFYSFWDNEFAEAAIIFKNLLQFEEIKGICYARWGKIDKAQNYPELYIWTGDNSVVTLSYDKIRDFGLLNMKSKYYISKKDSFKKSKAAKDAKEGF